MDYTPDSLRAYADAVRRFDAQPPASGLDRCADAWEAERAGHETLQFGCPAPDAAAHIVRLQAENAALQRALYAAIEEGGCPEGYEIAMDHETEHAALASLPPEESET